MKSNAMSFWLGMMGAGLCSLAACYKILWLGVIAGIMLITAIGRYTYNDLYNCDKFYEYHRNVQRALDAQENQKLTNEQVGRIDRKLKGMDKQKNIRHGSKPSATYEAMRAYREAGEE